MGFLSIGEMSFPAILVQPSCVGQLLLFCWNVFIPCDARCSCFLVQQFFVAPCHFFNRQRLICSRLCGHDFTNRYILSTIGNIRTNPSVGSHQRQNSCKADIDIHDNECGEEKIAEAFAMVEGKSYSCHFSFFCFLFRLRQTPMSERALSLEVKWRSNWI